MNLPRPSSIRLFAAVLALSLPNPDARACGEWFPPGLLEDRQAALTYLPEGTFAFEVGRLVRPGLVLRVEKWRDPDQAGLDAAQQAQIQAMRVADSLATAEGLRAPLPADIRLYTLGAVAWQLQDWAAARHYFEAVLALPETTKLARSTSAAYMLARWYQRQADPDQANQYFALTRQLNVDGAPDPLGLAVLSYGTQAAEQLAAGEIAAAVANYAQQAALGDQSGRDSLLIVARRLIADPAQLQSAISDPLVQRLLGAYLFSRGSEFFEQQPAGFPDSEQERVQRVVSAVQAAGLQQLAGAELLAAAAYRAGSYALAQDYLEYAAGPLALWVRAKLHFRAGDMQAGASALAQASRALPPDEAWASADHYSSLLLKPSCRIAGETGVLHLSRGDYLAAAEQLLAAGADYAADLAFVVERVLTLDELSSLVATHAAQALQDVSTAGDDQSRTTQQRRNINQLRWLAARRLLREGRDELAISLFDQPGLPSLASRYSAARSAGAAGDPVLRAQALTEAAQILREHGEDLLGFDSSVDPEPANDKLVAIEEAPRVSASDGGDIYRQDMRHAATKHLLAAADLLPVRSQAFAAVLCRATAFLIHDDPEQAASIYQRYLRDGAWVPWGEDFGRGSSDGSACPAPDFAGASAQVRAARWAEFKRSCKRMLPLLLFASAALALGVAGLILRTRRSRAKPIQN